MTVTLSGVHEYLTSNIITALNGAINDSVTTITVDDATGLPTLGYFRIEIDSELILCYGRSGNDLNVLTRGIEGTSAASHSDGAEVKVVATNAGVRRFLLDHRGTCYTEDSTFDDSHGWPVPLGRMMDEARADLTASSFTWQNQGSATIADHNGGVVMTIPDEAVIKLRGVTLSAPSTPYCFTARMWVGIAPGALGANSTHAGLWFRESSTGKLTTLSAQCGFNVAMRNWTDWNTFSATVDTAWEFDDIPFIWLRLWDDGTDVKGYYSLDGSNWSQDDSAWFQQGRTSFMSGGPNQIGIYLSSGTNSGNDSSGPAVCTVQFDNFVVEEL